MLTAGSLFSGIGGLELGLEMSGLVSAIAWQIEKDPFCQAVLARHWPEARRYGNILDVSGGGLAAVDLVCGGFPCQDVSAAGRKAGLSGSRSGLWLEFARVIGELRPQPRFVVVENVASGARLWVDQVRGDLGRLGYESLPIPIEARNVGAPHKRARVFVVAYAHGVTLRDEQQWGPARRAGLLQPQGQGLVVDARRPRGLALASAWPPVPALGGMGDGLPAGVDRDRNQALGNAVVPQVAEVVGHFIRSNFC